jgi:hypothetical protein
MRVSRMVTALTTLAAVVAVSVDPGCSPSKTTEFSVDASGDGPEAGESGAGLDFDAQLDALITSEAGFNDGRPEIDGMGCVADAGGPGPVQHICVRYPASADNGNECDGHHDLPGFPANGTGGNGFDDNCNGLVDEGCACDSVGTTKDCYLVPASQTVGGLPVGWCAQNSKGTVDCQKPNVEATPTWSGNCRGAQPPFADDFCAPGDFNCDGKEENSTTQNCSCAPGTIQCPTQPVTTIPYPTPNALPLKLDAAAWFVTQSDVAMASGWKWTLLGGDCDNILPYPTFGIYGTNDGTGNPVGALFTNLGQSGKEHGIVAVAPVVHSSIYPAFSLSGDYSMKTEWDLKGKHYSCLEKIQVRAPGLRAEACWDTEGSGIDLDLHVAKVNGFPSCMTSHGWSDLSCQSEDCYYNNCYTPMGTFPSWGYSSSSSSACTGWGSEAGQQVVTCGNPRLDRDANGLSGTCDPSNANPNGGGTFCGPENINVDTPDDGSRFAVAVRYYNGVLASKTHVNIYCDGVRIMTTGYDPTTGNDFPQLRTAGQDMSGDMWKVGLVTTHVTPSGLSCDAQPTQSQNPHAMTDGSSSYCVDNTTSDGAQSAQLLTSGGFEPLNANALCFH